MTTVSPEGTHQIIANLRAEGQTSRADYLEALLEWLADWAERRGELRHDALDDYATADFSDVVAVEIATNIRDHIPGGGRKGRSE